MAEAVSMLLQLVQASFFLILLSLSLLCIDAEASFSPTDSFLINCGSQSNTTIDGRRWIPVSQAHLISAPTNILFILPLKEISITPSPNELNAAALLNSACVFPNGSSFTFPVSAGRFVIRLYFYLFASSLHNLNSASFSISANEFNLLAFDIAAINHTPDFPYIFKEYSINVSSHTLTLSFHPSMGSFAFVNALEVASMPYDIIQDLSSPLDVNSPQSLGVAWSATECMYRVNVGGPFISPGNDSAGLYRTWKANESFLFSAAGAENVSTDRESIVYPPPLPLYIAPRVVYSTALQMQGTEVAESSFNISWVFPVDPGFVYVVRLHLCEIVYMDAGVRIFDIYLQNQTAYHALDLSSFKNPDHAYYRDFTVNASGGVDRLWVQVGPTPNAATAVKNAILNGIEVWKLNNSAGSLDNAMVATPLGPHVRKAHYAPIIGGIIAGVLAVGFATTCICVFCCRKSRTSKHATPTWFPLSLHGGNSASIASKISTMSRKSNTGSYVSSIVSSLGRQFSFSEIQEATGNFDETQVLGVGGFGKVYKGMTDDGTMIAVKRGNPRSEQGITEFQTEIAMLSKLRHRHLVSLIGYCDEDCEMILVYEYMANGPLRSHLYGTDLPPLSWRQRLDICIGAARGLHYLHTGAAQGIIHRDVKTTNILLDENLVAKVSDFGLSKTGPTLDRTHVSTAVKGSFGYLDPEYFRRQQLTEKSDVYSFGVVLMEVLCARPAINPALPRDQVNIAEWAMHWQKTGLLDQIVDPHIGDTINANSLRKYGETAEKCLAEQGLERPTMGDVLWNLENVVQLQEADATGITRDDHRQQSQSLELSVLHPAQQSWNTSAGEPSFTLSVASGEHFDDATPSALFSQLVNPKGGYSNHGKF